MENNIEDNNTIGPQKGMLLDEQPFCWSYFGAFLSIPVP